MSDNMQEPAWTNFHCHSNVDPVCEPDLTPAVYAGLLGEEMRRAVITDHGFMHYFVHVGDILWSGKWMEDSGHFDAAREIGNVRLRAAIQSVRELGNPNIFSGIETDMMRDGRLTHDPEFTEEFDVILCGLHFAPWIEKLEAEAAREKAWLDYVDVLLDKPEVDVFSHPFRWIAISNKGQVSDDAIARVLRWVEDRGVTLELNSNNNMPEATEVRMLRIAADRGLPVVIGTDSHQRAQIMNRSIAQHRLALAGLTMKDLYLPEVEDFMARKGKRAQPRPPASATTTTAAPRPTSSAPGSPGSPACWPPDIPAPADAGPCP